MKNSKAFTLAEVLITLGIIGIVAAMTLPALINNYKKQEISVRLKKFNSIMAQALITSQDENGPVNEWDKSLTPENYLRKYIAPYIKSLKIGTKTGTYYGQIYFTDGSSILVSKGDCADFHFDVNGDKKPNKYGYDKFLFLACPTTAGGWCNNKGWCTYYPKSWDQSRETKLSKCKSDARYCSALLEYDNWEFKEDYPYKL